MDKYVGLDVSMEETSVCILDAVGNVIYEGKTASQPDALAKLLRAKARDAIRVVFETGALASWLWHELKARNFPVICLDARHARAALSMRVNKTDRNDALALLNLHGWAGTVKPTSKAWKADTFMLCWRHAPSWLICDGTLRTRYAAC